MLMHLSAEYARDSGISTMCPRGLTARYIVLIVLSTLLCGAEAWTVYRRQVNTLHALLMRHMRFDHEDNLDGQSDKRRNTRKDRAAIYGRTSDQKESPVDWTPHENITRQATKAGSLLSTVFWSQKERDALVSGSRISSRET